MLGIKGQLLDIQPNDITLENMKNLYKEKGTRLFCFCSHVFHKDKKRANRHFNFYDCWNYADSWQTGKRVTHWLDNVKLLPSARFIEFETEAERNFFRDLFYNVTTYKLADKVSWTSLIQDVLGN